MVVELRIKRRTSGNAGAPASLANAELAFSEVDDILYYGKGTAGAGGTATEALAIAGPGAFLNLSGTQTVTGNKTFTGDVNFTGTVSGVGGGTVTSVALSGGTTGLTVTGSPITSTGTITLAGTLAIANGGTGATTRQGAINALAGATTSGQYLRGNGTNILMSAIQAADVPTLNQNTTGTAANVTGTVAIANGGTGATTAANALTNLGAYPATNPSGYTTNTGTVTGVTATSPVVSSGGTAPIISLAAGYGDTTNPYASKTATHVLAAPSGANGVPSFRALVAADIPTLTVAKISDFATQVQATRLDQLAAPTADVALNSRKITGLADPTAAQDAATKSYVDAIKQGLDVKDSVQAATTANITLSGTQTIDGVAVVAGNRVLVKNQTTASANGIYVVASGAWTRTTDADTSAKVTPGLFTFVEGGTTNADSGWVLTNIGTITLGTTALTFAQFSGAGQITAGAGLTKTGNTLSVSTVPVANGGTGQTSFTNGELLIGNSTGNTLSKATLSQGSNVTITNGAGTITIAATNTTYSAGNGLSLTGTTFAVGGTTNRITTTATTVDIASTYVGQASITTLGTISTGTWAATAIGATRGGTGLTTVPKGSVLVSNTANQITALDGSGSTNKLLFYDAATDTVSWVNSIDGGTF